MAISITGLLVSFWDWSTIFLVKYFWWLVIGGVLIYFFMKRRKEKNYNYKVRAYKRREGNKRLEVNFPAGYFKDKQGVTFFKVKLSWKPWEHRIFYTLPDPDYMDEDNRVYYEIVNPNLWVQCKRTFIPEKVKMIEIEFLRDYAAYKQGYKAFVREDAVDTLARVEGLIRTTGQLQEIEVTDITYKAISSADKKLINTEVFTGYQALGVDGWKTTAIWVGGMFGILLCGLLAYLLVSGQLTG